MRTHALAIAAALVLATVLIPTQADAAARTWSVDCGAHANGSGSTSSPWNSVAAVNAHGAYRPGDRILFKRGTACAGALAPAGNGTAHSPILIGAYGTGSKPTIAGGGTSSWEGGVQLTDQQWWTVQDLHVTNSDGDATTPFYRSGVLLLNRSGAQLHGDVLRRLTIDHVVSSMSDVGNGSRSFGGISVITMPGLSGGFTDLLIQGNSVSGVGRTGIITTNISWGRGADVRPRITGNSVSHTRGDGIVMLGARDGRIDHDVSAYANDEWPCPDCGGVSPRTANAAIWTGSSKAVRIDHDEAYGTKQPGGDGEGFDVDIAAVDTIVEDNYAHDNAGGGILICGSTGAVVRFNVLEDNAYGTFTFIGSIPAHDTTISNNTVSVSKRSGGQVVRTFGGTGGSRIRFFNNLAYVRASTLFQWPSAVAADHNTFVGLHGATEPRGAGTSHTDPGLRAPGTGGNGFPSISGYRPRSSTHALVGAPITRDVRTDIFGTALDPRHPPRGAAA